MINLVPTVGLKAVKKEYWVRVVSVWLLIFGTICLVGTVFLLPGYIKLTMQINDINAAANTLKESAISFDESAAQLIDANNQAQLLVRYIGTVAFSDYITAVESVANQGIIVDSFVLAQPASLTSFTVVGKASTRRNLELFRDQLEALPVFLAVQLPISNFITDRDISFSMNIIISTSTRAI